MEKQSKQISIDAQLYDSIKDYCSLNGIKMKGYVQDLLQKSFNEDKYGKSPFERAGKVPVEEKPTKKVEVIAVKIDEAEKVKGTKSMEEDNVEIVMIPVNDKGAVIGEDMHDDGTLSGKNGEDGSKYLNKVVKKRKL